MIMKKQRLCGPMTVLLEWSVRRLVILLVVTEMAHGSVFTRRPIAEYLVENFTGLKYKELEWLENPLEKTLSSGKPRIKKAKWLPGHPADIVHLYSDAYIDADDQTSVATDFFTVFRNHKKWVAKRLMNLDISGMGIDFLPPSIFQLPELERIDVRGNKLSEECLEDLKKRGIDVYS